MRKQLRLLWFFMKPYRREYIAIGFMNVLVAVTECSTLALILPIFQSLTGAGAVGNTTQLQNVLQRVLGIVPVNDILIASCLLILVVSVVRCLLLFFNEYLIANTSGRVMADLKVRIFHRYAYDELDELLSQKQGRLVYTLGTSPGKVASALIRLPQLSASLFTALSIIGFLFTLQWKFALILLLVGCAIYLILSGINKKRVYQVGRETARVSGDLNVVLNEFVSGIKQITVNNARSRWIDLNRSLSQRLSRLYVQTNLLLVAPKNIIDTFSIFSIALLIMGCKLLWGDTFIGLLPTLGVFFMSTLRLVPHFSAIGNTAVTLSSTLADCEIVHESLTRPSLPPFLEARLFSTLNHSIRFENVSFGHRGRNRLLDSVSFSIERNKITALVGKSGSGKSTIINLLLGLYQPNDGRIVLDDIALNHMDLDSWRSRIGFVSQDTFIFHSTIADNIAFQDQRYTRDEIEDAARIANAHDFIMSFPQGYETLVGERGMKLSGGQQQRIAIARTVIRKPEVYIFDEATSALDPISETQVQEAISTVSQGHTTLIIAHRLSTIRKADHILVLENGRIAEQGCHEDLLKNKKRYWDLYQEV